MEVSESQQSYLLLKDNYEEIDDSMSESDGCGGKSRTII